MKIVCLCGSLRSGRSFVLDVLFAEMAGFIHVPIFESTKKVRNQFVKQVPSGTIQNRLLHHVYLLSSADKFGEYYLPITEVKKDIINVIVCPFSSAITLSNRGVQTYIIQIVTGISPKNKELTTQREYLKNITTFKSDYDISKLTKDIQELLYKL